MKQFLKALRLHPKSGEIIVLFSNAEFEVVPGTSVVMPRNSVHGWVNLGPETARLLFTFMPGGIDDFFPQIGQTPPEDWTDLGHRYDTAIVGAPLSLQAPSANAAACPAKQHD